MHRCLWWFLLLLLSGVSSAAEYQVRLERNVAAAMRDGATLKADIYRPDAQGQFPVLLARTPYGKANSDSSGMARRGYIAVVQDVRGRGESEGVFHPFMGDEQDGYDSVEWAAQLPGSNGKVGMFGGSYGGLTQMMAAAAAPPHLVAIFPVFPAIGFDSHQLLFEGGAFRQLVAQSWGVAQTTEHYPKTIARMAADAGYFTEVMKRLPLGDFMEAVHREVMARGGGGYFREWVRNAPGSDYWQRVDFAGKVGKIRAPGCYVGGWFDLFGPATAAVFNAIQRGAATEAARTKSQLILGPWTHGGSRAPVGDADFGKEAAISFGAYQNLWFDYWLKGEANEVPSQPAVRVFLMGENRWLPLAAWPPQQARPYRLYLSGSQSLNEQGAEGQPDVLEADPANPVPTRGGGLCCHLGFPAGTFDQRQLAERKDVLSYTTAPLERALAVAGEVSVVLWLAASTSDADIAAKLIDVDPSGKALNLADGALRLRYRNSFVKAEPLRPGKTFQVRVKLGSTAHTFRAGHRLRLMLAGSDFPYLSVNLNTGEELEKAVRGRVARTRIFHDAQRASCLELAPVTK